MKGETVKKLLKASYANKKQKIDTYERNNKLSGKRVQVFYDPNTKKAVVSHRGSKGAIDWLKTNTAMALGYEGGNRFRHAKKIQKKAEKLYGPENVTTIGHSLGGRIAEKVGQKSSKVITYNKAVTPRSLLKPTSIVQTDIRTKNDAVSVLGRFQKKNGKTIQIKDNSNPIKAHGLQHLSSIKNKLI